MSVTEILNSQDGAKHFSFEVLPPLKGAGTDRLFSTIEKFRDFDPAYINITTHHSEYVYRELDNGQYERLRVRRRPGTVAIAATIQKNFGIPVFRILSVAERQPKTSNTNSSTCSFLR